MILKEMFKKTKYISLEGKEAKNDEQMEPSCPEGLFVKCCDCGALVYSDDLIANLYVCPKCGHYHRIDPRTRISMIADVNTWNEINTDVEETNPLEYPGYEEKIEKIKHKYSIDEAIVTGICEINGMSVVVGICDTRFMMGSMGYVVGEKLTRAVEKATAMNLPLIVFTCSGGARMQEGIVSLMQMAKVSESIRRHSEDGNLYISILTDPTTGGVTASFAMQGDIILAEPQALIGFAGPRVIKQTIGQELPKGFQKAEFLLEHGLIDSIVERKELKDTLALLLRMHMKRTDYHIEEYKDYLANIKKIRHINNESQKLSNAYDPWEKVKIARDNNRPTSLDYINGIFKDFYELHGDRAYRDDGAIVGGVAMFGKMPVTVIGQQKGTNTKDNIKRNFGMPYPEGYRKALRLMKQAEKFNRPIICFIDTPGAYCGIEAEERGQGEAIAKNLFEMAGLKVPVLSIVIGEGGSGGALAMAVANQVWMLENAVYSVLSPEGFASILWKDAKMASEAAQVMKITASDLKELGIVEKIILEHPQASMDNLRKICFSIKLDMVDFMIKYKSLSGQSLVNDRYERFRQM